MLRSLSTVAARIAHVAVLLSAVVLCAKAQVVQINGGVSSLYESQGGSVGISARSYDMTVGAGMIDGQMGGGATLTKRTDSGTFIVGDSTVAIGLPTDVFSGSRYLLMTGVGVKTKRYDADVQAFAGMTASYLGSPLFDGVRADQGAGALIVKKTLPSDWTSTTDVLAGRHLTLLEGLQWSPSKDTQVAASAGFGEGVPYEAVSGYLHRQWIEAKGEYVQGGYTAPLIGVGTMQYAEPVNENVFVTVHPFRFLSFSGGHQNFLISTSSAGIETSATSELNQLSTTALVQGARISLGLYESQYAGHENDSVMVSAVREITSRTSLEATYIESHTNGYQRTKLLIATGKEVINPRWTLTETLDSVDGNTSVNFGGSFLSNFITLNANYQTFYVPTRIAKPFQQSLIFNGQISLFGRLTVNAGSYVDPLGNLLYTTGLHLIASHAGANQSATRMEVGDFAVRGHVVDAAGKTIEGAALMLDKAFVYTDASGAFEIRERKARNHVLKVALDQFVSAQHFELVSAPGTIRSTSRDDDPGATIVVRKIARQGN